MLKEPQKRGETASRECEKIEFKKNKLTQSKKEKTLLYIKYEDHVLFKNSNSTKIVPSIRKVVGWLISETKNHITICYDMPLNPQLNEKKESGFIILKNTIIEAYEVTRNNPFKQKNPINYGNKKPKKRNKQC